MGPFPSQGLPLGEVNRIVQFKKSDPLNSESSFLYGKLTIPSKTLFLD